MTDFTTIDLNNLLPGEPLTSAKVLALYENPLAIQEGDATAPRIQVPAIDSAQLTAAIIAAIVGIEPGGVAYSSDMIEKGLNKPSRSAGDTLAGSNLTPISFRSGASADLNDTIVLLDASGSTASGTWKLGADYAFSASENDNPIAKWTRIS